MKQFLPSISQLVSFKWIRGVKNGKRGYLKAIFYGGIVVLVGFLAFYPTYHLTAIGPQNLYYTKPLGNLEDYYQYLSLIKQGRHEISGMNRYTLESVMPDTLHTYYEILGSIGRFLPISDVMIFYGSIALALSLYSIASIALVCLLVPSYFQPLALLFVFLASPLPNWWIHVFGIKIYLGTIDWTRMDLYHRYAMAPHHIMGVALSITGVYLLCRFLQKKKLFLACLSGFVFAMSSFVFFVPGALAIASFITASGIWVVHVLWKKSVKEIQNIFFQGKIHIIGSAIVIVPFFCMTASIMAPVTTGGLSHYEYLVYKPDVFPNWFSIFLLSQGILLIFYPFVFRRFCNKKMTFEQIFILMLVGIPLVLFLLSAKGFLVVNKFRFAYSAPYLYGGIFAAWGVGELFLMIKKKFRSLLYIGIATLILLTTWFGIRAYWIVETVPTPPFINVYIPMNHLAGVQFLEKNTPFYSHVLASFYTGMYMPALTYNKVFIGHEVATVNFKTKYWDAIEFFDGDMETKEAAEFFDTNKIEYVYWDSKADHSRYDQIMTRIFQNDSVQIYRVNKLSSKNP